jgi:two-component system phosphate regulon sensor histidine kinase PhoR
VIVFHDITELRRLENARRDFVTNVSHELKTPITSIKGFVETLLEGALQDPDDARRFLGIIAKQAGRLDAIIDDLLNLSRIELEVDRPELPREVTSVGQTVEAAIQACKPNAERKNMRVSLESDEDTQAHVNTALIQLAVENLIDNAVKYSEPNTDVRIEVRRQPDHVAIAVHDHGCGIEREHIERIFERFYRVDKARSRKLGGTGLGLAIVKHIVRLHGGNVLVESVPREGSTFTIVLPAEDEPAPTPTSASQ